MSSTDNLREFKYKSPSSGRGPKVIILILILVLILVAFGIYHFYELDVTTTEITTVSEEKATLTYQYQGLLNEYDNLEISNDTLSARLAEERENVKEIMEKLQNTSAENKSLILKYKKELKTLRNVMKSFIVQIDSLNQSNIALRSENKVIKQQFYTEQQKATELLENLEQEREKVAIASVIRAVNMSIQTFTSKGKPTDKAKRVSRLGVSFTLDENPLAEIGIKKIYVRFTNPENHVLIHGKGSKFIYEEEEIAYSAYREIDYTGAAVKGIVYYQNKEENLISGKYKVDIFCSGKMIGSTVLYLR